MTILRKVALETVIPEKFKFVASDLNGSVHVYENKPNLDYGTQKNPVACDMWDDPSGGDTMPISPNTPISAGFLTEALGDWRDSCMELKEEVSKDTPQ